MKEMTTIAPEKIQEVVTKREVMDCFFQGAIAGYAGGGDYKQRCYDLAGGKVFRYETDKLIYTDMYVSNGPQSGGMTVIFLNFLDIIDIPLWMMQYEGEELINDKQVTKFVKKALFDTYSENIFYGGRGFLHYPPVCMDSIWGTTNGIRYCNVVDQEENTFSRFSGREEVLDGVDRILFYHNYSGKLLVPLY